MKVISEISLRDFKFWSGGEDRAKNCTDEQLDKIESIMESDAPESGWTDDDINNFFWFDFDTIADWLGYKDEKHFDAGVREDDVKEAQDWFEKKISTSRICQGLDLDIPKERGYEVTYNETIKGSIEEELADAVIHLLDLAGLRGISLEPAMKDINSDVIDDSADSCVSETFTETIYAISTLPVRYDGLFDFPTTVNDMIVSIFGLAKHLEIDLFWHIEQKMRYNELREKMHGKKY